MPSQPARLAIYGEFGIGNAGNDESGRVLASLLSERGWNNLTALTPEPTTGANDFATSTISFVVRPSDGPRRRLDHLRRVADKGLDLVRLLAAVRSFDAVFVSGTGLLEPRQGRYPGGDLIWLAMLSLACRRHGVPLVWFGVGGGRIRHRATGWLAVFAARCASRRSYRDHTTRESLARYGLDVSADTIIPDLVLARREEPDTHERKPGTIAIGAMDVPTNVNRERYLNELARTVQELVRAGHSIQFVVGDHADLAVTREIIARIPGDLAGVKTPLGTRFGEILSGVDGVDVVVGSRYHVLIGSIISGVPMLALSHADKDDALMRDLDLANFLYQAETFTAESVANGVEAARADRQAIIEKLRDARETGRAAVLAELDASLRTIIEKRPHG